MTVWCSLDGGWEGRERWGRRRARGRFRTCNRATFRRRAAVAVGRILAWRGMAVIPPAPCAHERLSVLMPTMPLHPRSCTTHRNERFGMTSCTLRPKWGEARASEVVVGGQEREAGSRPLERTFFCWSIQLHGCPRGPQGAVRMGNSTLLGRGDLKARCTLSILRESTAVPFASSTIYN